MPHARLQRRYFQGQRVTCVCGDRATDFGCVAVRRRTLRLRGDLNKPRPGASPETLSVSRDVCGFETCVSRRPRRETAPPFSSKKTARPTTGMGV